MSEKNGISLHIGLNKVDQNHYVDEDGKPWDGKLNACESDAEDMRDLASSQGFKTNIMMTEQATREAILKMISDASKVLTDGDFFLVTYSGHGGRIKDYSGDEDDLRDETWVLYDCELIDDELGHLWSKFDPGVRILIISDSCHSGSVYKGLRSDSDILKRKDGIKYRFMPHGVSYHTFKKNRSFYMDVIHSLPKGKPIIKAPLIHISGCQDDEFSLDGEFNGLFTGHLLRTWDQGNFQGNYIEFHQAVQMAVSKAASKVLTEPYNKPHKQTPNFIVDGSIPGAFSNQKPPFRI